VSVTKIHTCLLALLTGAALVATQLRSEDQGQGPARDRERPAGAPASPARASAPAAARPSGSRPGDAGGRQPLIINMGHSSSGGHGANYPKGQPASAAPARPSWGRQGGGSPSAWRASGQGQGQGRQGQAHAGQSQLRHGLNAWAPQGSHAAAVVHHHPYATGYVRRKLQKLGVASEPAYITDRGEIVHTDRQHSSVRLPTLGPDHTALHATPVLPRGDAALRIRTQMDLVAGDGWRQNAEAAMASETEAGRYYWHQDRGFDWCHTVDEQGYHWFGWYLGDAFFWTRSFGGRWWWYDGDNDRWDFYNEGFWWWQDPYHVGDLYCYSDGAYIPANSSEDQIVVTQPDGLNLQSFASPDGTRTVKLVAGSDDAFLYDDTNPPGFDPIYLASGVKSVEFSSGNGRPLEIMLRLADGSFDLFDAQGQPYNPGAFDADAEAQGQGAPGETGTGAETDGAAAPAPSVPSAAP